MAITQPLTPSNQMPVNRLTSFLSVSREGASDTCKSMITEPDIPEPVWAGLRTESKKEEDVRFTMEHIRKILNDMKGQIATETAYLKVAKGPSTLRSSNSIGEQCHRCGHLYNCNGFAYCPLCSWPRRLHYSVAVFHLGANPRQNEVFKDKIDFHTRKVASGYESRS